MLTTFAVLLISAVPEDEDVVAGPWGALVMGGLVIATALLCWSFTRQLKKAKNAKAAGVYGDEPEQPAAEDSEAASNGSDES